MKKILFSACAYLLVSTGIAQDGYKHCYTTEAMNKWFATHPEAKAEYLIREQQAAEEDALMAKNNYQQKTAAVPAYTIPVVFHVLHLNGSENISDAQINDAVAILNRDYRKKNADTTAVVAPFTSIIADVNFEFKLATKDPAGNCTSGITRHAVPTTNWTSGNLPDYAYTWPPSKYLNIYVVKTISSGAAGYTYLPGTASTAMDAIVILHDYVGSIGTGGVGTSRALTHEVGHWLNLQHTWGNTNNPGVACGNDNVSDTPVTEGFTSCPGSPASAQICNAGVTENYQNYMDYSYCSRMFTNGQATRMTTAINSSTGGRNNLWINSNLIATGIISPLSPCAPVADCHSASGSIINLYTICAGQSLNFYDDSYNGAVTSRTWSSSGSATIASPGASLTSITFSSPGTETITLAVNNSMGSSSITKVVTILPGTAFVTGTYQESFEPTGLPSNWTVINQTGGTTWQQNFGAAASGNNSYYMNNNINPNGAIDILQTPSYDFLNNTGATFTLKYAYARYNSTFADVFKIQASSNCGGSWTDIYVPTAAVLASGSGGTTTTPFVPTPSQFKTYTLTSHPAFGTFKLQSNVQIRFYFKEDPTAGFGNNFYLDDINFNLPLGVNELTQSIGFNVYPNPTSGAVNIAFTLSDKAEITCSVCDIIGRPVETKRSVSFEPGQHTMFVNENSQLKPGVYFVNFEMNGQMMSRKLIIE